MFFFLLNHEIIRRLFCVQTCVDNWGCNVSIIFNISDILPGLSLSLSSSLTNTHLSLSGLIWKSTCSLCCQKLFSHPSQGGVTDWQWGGLTALNLKGVGGQGASGSTDICIYGRGDLSLTGGSSGGLY